ncbi:unnamed protein product [Rhizophagus irregularis]|nr:unnamed protein product [Rhizophagus irregularis]
MSQKETLAKDSLVIKQAKLVFLGESSVGKSSIILRFASNIFQENLEPTVGAAFMTQKCRLEDKIIKFEIWDTAGQERFHSLAQMYYRNAHVAVVVYDVTNMDSFNRAKSWIKELNNQANSNIIIALLGNKIDLSRRQVSTEIAKNYALEFGLLFYEISARKDHGIREVFTKIVKLLCEDSSLKRKSKDSSLEQKSKDSSLEQKSKDSSLEQKSEDSILEQKRKHKKIIWVKFNEEPIKIAFNGEDIFDLIEEAKIKLNGLDKIKMDLIEVYKHNSVEPLKFGQVVDDSFINRYETPVEIKVKSEVIIPNDLGNLLETGECHDTIVKVGDEATGQEFKVHSQIIGARSKYFRSALSNNQNMKREDGKFYFVKPNISSEVFQIILRYVYGGAVSLKGRDA